jgi:hypothetical protein
MSAVTESKSFQEKMQDRIRDSIGDLISEEELKTLIDRGMEEAFFKGKVIKDSYGRVQREELPLIHQMVNDHIKPIVEQEVAKYIDNNREQVAEIVQQTLEVGAGTLLIKALNQTFQNSLISLQNSMITDLRNNGVIR